MEKRGFFAKAFYLHLSCVTTTKRYTQKREVISTLLSVRIDWIFFSLFLSPSLVILSSFTQGCECELGRFNFSSTLHLATQWNNRAEEIHSKLASLQTHHAPPNLVRNIWIDVKLEFHSMQFWMDMIYDIFFILFERSWWVDCIEFIFECVDLTKRCAHVFDCKFIYFMVKDVHKRPFRFITHRLTWGSLLFSIGRIRWAATLLPYHMTINQPSVRINYFPTP